MSILISYLCTLFLIISQRVMSHLVERYVASKTAADVSVEADISIADIRALRNDLLALK